MEFSVFFMESVGKYLKDLRLTRSISIEEVVRNTNIPRKYIEGIEKDNFSDFPGEVYIKGYIKSYASFLGGDPEYALRLYERKQIEEKEIPLEQLIGKASIFDRIDFRKLGWISIGVFIVLVLIVLIVNLIISKGYEVLVDNSNVKTILKSFSEGEEFRDKVGNTSVKIKLLEVRNNGNDIVLSINDSIYSFVLKNRSMMDFNMDGIVDLEMRYEAFIDKKPRLRISFYKSQEKTSKEENVFLEGGRVPVDFEISSDEVVWVSLIIDNSEENQFYLGKDNSRKLAVRNKLVLKTSDVKNLNVRFSDRDIKLDGEGPSYIVFEVVESVKGVLVKIQYLE
ncbi:MAG: helix-turn-helix domain-containing protein [Brevinematales bacterium]|nr:helix-turn-helix domain-containing protein [Brevinematales bacterium]